MPTSRLAAGRAQEADARARLFDRRRLVRGRRALLVDPMGCERMPRGAARAKEDTAMRARMLLLGCALALGLPCFAPAAEWDLGLGAAFVDLPAWPGADVRMRLAAPFPYLRYLGKRLAIRNNRVRWLLAGRDDLWLDLSFSGGVPAPSRGRRAGMPAIPWHLQAGPRLNLRLFARDRRRLMARLAWRGAVDVRGRGMGWLLVPELHWEDAHLRASLALPWASRRYLARFYGVPAAFARPGRPAFAPTDGFAHLRLSLLWRARRGNARFWLGGTLYELGPFRVSASPLVASSRSLAWGAGVVWVFSSSSSTETPAATSALR